MQLDRFVLYPIDFFWCIHEQAKLHRSDNSIPTMNFPMQYWSILATRDTSGLNQLKFFIFLLNRHSVHNSFIFLMSLLYRNTYKQSFRFYGFKF